MNKKKKIGIVGEGYVGKAMSSFFHKHYEVVVYDIKPLKPGTCTGYLTNNFDDLKPCDLVLVCVPTPMKEDGKCDTSIVEDVISKLENDLIIIKSTVEPGTTDRLKKLYGKNIVFSPEYCGESSYWTPYKFHTDVKETPFFIFGGERKDTSKCVDFYMKVVGPTKTYKQTTSLEAELAKYVENTFYATKITFCYELANICKMAGADWNEVRECWLLDPRINSMHTSVFAENDKCYSGKCLPKDLSGLTEYSKSLGYDPKLLQQVIDSNERIGEFRKNNK